MWRKVSVAAAVILATFTAITVGRGLVQQFGLIAALPVAGVWLVCVPPARQRIALAWAWAAPCIAVAVEAALGVAAICLVLSAANSGMFVLVEGHPDFYDPLEDEHLLGAMRWLALAGVTGFGFAVLHQLRKLRQRLG